LYIKERARIQRKKKREEEKKKIPLKGVMTSLPLRPLWPRGGFPGMLSSKNALT
jgi:hypothetical protein